MARILIVDDDDTFRMLMAAALTRAGFEVRQARDYRQALPVLNGDAALDLLITDIVMPHAVNGFALARMAQMKRPALKVLYVTAFDVSTREALGPVLCKPITEPAFLAAVRAELAKA